MKSFREYARLYKIFVVQYTKSLMQSKLDFVIGLTGFLLVQLSGIAFLYLVFQQIPTMNNWTFEQLLFIYGFAQIPRGLDHLLTDNLWMVAWRMVVMGTFDRYMLRPMNLFFQIVCEKFQFDALGELIVGFVLVWISVKNGVVTISFVNICLFIISVIAGTVIYTSIKLFFASTAFWFKESAPFLETAYGTSEFAKYPTEIYSKPVKFVITWILPFAYVAFIPTTYFLVQASVLKTIVAECVVAFVLWNIAYWLFKRGTRIYESAGN